MYKKGLTGKSDNKNHRIHRRSFLAVSGIAALSTTGFATETVEAATLTSTDELGYGIDSYGAVGYGGVETTQ